MNEPKNQVELIDPLDYLILDQLPIEGTMFAGAYPQGPTVKNLTKVIAEGKLTSTQISSRVRLMHYDGLTVKVKGMGTSGVHVWQRTEKGTTVLNEWKERRKRDGTK